MGNHVTKLLDKARTQLTQHPPAALASAREALSISEQSGPTNQHIESLYMVGISLREMGNPKEAFSYYEKAVSLIDKSTPNRVRAFIYSALSIYHALRYQKKEALEFANMTLSCIDVVSDYECLISVYARIGACYIKLSLYTEALSLLIKAEAILNEDFSLKDEGYIYSHLSVVQSRMKNYEESLKWSYKAGQVFESINNKRGIISCLINRAMVYYYYNSNIDECISILYKAKVLCEEDMQQFGATYSLVLMNLTNNYAHDEKKDYDKSLGYALESYGIAKKLGIENIVCLTLGGMVKAGIHLGTFPSMLEKEGMYSLEDIMIAALEKNGQINDPLISKVTYEIAIEFYESREDYKMALYYQKKLTEIKDRISDKEKDENLFALNIKHETYRKEIRLKQLELEKKELELQQKEELKEINRQLEEKVKARTTQILAKNHELEQYAYIVAHDLKEPIRSIVGFSQLLERKEKENISDNSKELLGYIKEASYNMREMVDDLLKYSTIHVDEENFKEVNLSQLLEKVFLNLRNAIKESNAKIIVGDIPEHITCDPIRIRQLFQNIISNAIKFRHQERNCIIKIKGYKSQKGYTFSIKDNGIGISDEFFDKIFLLFRRLHTKDKFNGSGIGLSVCKKIVNLHGGDIWVTSEDNKGTTFHFTMQS